VVPVNKIELNGASSWTAAQGDGAVLRLIHKLIHAAHEAKRTGCEVELQVHCDLDQELADEGSDSEDDAGTAADSRGAASFDQVAASQFATVRGVEDSRVSGEADEEEVYIAY